jgi:hypothetical protein
MVFHHAKYHRERDPDEGGSVKRKEKIEKLTDEELAANRAEERVALAKLLEAGPAGVAQYEKDRQKFLKESDRPLKRKPGDKMQAQSKILISGAVVMSLTDKRFRRLPDTFATEIAIQAMREAARQTIRWLPRAASRDWLENLVIAALDGDDQFFAELADSFRALREQGFTVDREGIITKKLDASKGKKYVFANFRDWIRGNTKLESLVAYVKKEFGMTRKDFFKALKEARSIPESPI